MGELGPGSRRFNSTLTKDPGPPNKVKKTRSIKEPDHMAHPHRKLDGEDQTDG